MVTGTGSITGPTHAMAIYLEMFHRFPDRYSLVHLIVPKLEELISRTLLGLFKIRLLFQDRVRSQNFRF